MSSSLPRHPDLEISELRIIGKITFFESQVTIWSGNGNRIDIIGQSASEQIQKPSDSMVKFSECDFLDGEILGFTLRHATFFKSQISYQTILCAQFKILDAPLIIMAEFNLLKPPPVTDKPICAGIDQLYFLP